MLKSKGIGRLAYEMHRLEIEFRGVAFVENVEGTPESQIILWRTDAMAKLWPVRE